MFRYGQCSLNLSSMLVFFGTTSEHFGAKVFFLNASGYSWYSFLALGVVHFGTFVKFQSFGASW